MPINNTPSVTHDGSTSLSVMPNLPPRPSAPQTQSQGSGVTPVYQGPSYMDPNQQTNSWSNSNDPLYQGRSDQNPGLTVTPNPNRSASNVDETWRPGTGSGEAGGIDAVSGAAPSTGNPAGRGSGGTGGGSGGTGGGSGGTGGGSGGTGGGSGGTGGGTGGSGSGGNGAGYTDAQLLSQIWNAAADATPYKLPKIDGPTAEALQHVDVSELRGILEQILESQKQQSGAQIDYSVEQGVNELTRAMEDAAKQYQTQRDQAAIDEARALDNMALYNEARGDRGGIGASQYASIQAAAAQNRRAVNDAQVKLGTDTARQISDLRAQGEFQKADQLLSLTQSYLSQLMSLEQWALQTNLGVDEFNTQLQQWKDEYNLNVQKYLTDLDLSAAQLTGVFANGTKTLAYQNQLQDSLASSGSALLSAGILPSRQQLEAMGMTEAQAKAYIKKAAG